MTILERNTIHCADIFDLCGRLDPQSVDMILCDLPYGTTACSWDTVIPFAPMWDAFKRIIKPRGAIVLTASQPFTSLLVCSNLAWFRHEWVWDKCKSGNIFLANSQPMKIHENVLVFSQLASVFYPIMTQRQEIKRSKNYGTGYAFGGNRTAEDKLYEYTQTYPKSIIVASNAKQSDKAHPTQKPVALFEYLIRTYTQPGELVFDPCVGSGTTALAARNCGRDYIVGDSSPEYVAIAQKRLDAPYTLPLLPEEKAGEVYETKPFELEG